MLELQAATRPMSASRRSTGAAENPVERFLVASERRVIVHCQKKVLRTPNLPVEQQRRLERLLADARQAAGVRFNSKLTDATIQKFFCRTLLNFALVFVFGFLPLTRCWAPDLGPADLTGRRTTVLHWCLALLRNHLALRRTWL
jgi:hypothetical protein